MKSVLNFVVVVRMENVTIAIQMNLLEFINLMPMEIGI